MKKVFADSFYWIALINPYDAYHDTVKAFGSTLGDIKIVTTDEVLIEFLTALSRGGEKLRKIASMTVREVIDSKNAEVIQQTHESFANGLNLYEKRLDKTYSLVDCISMQTMKKMKINSVLTKDIHFAQEGFDILIKE